MFWNNTTAPKIAPAAPTARIPALIASAQGWINSKTGEVVVAVRGLTTKNGDAAAAPTLSLAVPANATYVTGNVLSFTLNSSAALTVIGSPSIDLTVGGNKRRAVYNPTGSTSIALKFEYTVQAADGSANVAITAANTLNKSTNGRKKGRLTYVNGGRTVLVEDSKTITVPSLALVKV